MKVMNRARTLLRWGGIGIISLCYFIALALSSFSFSAFSESESMRFTGPILLKEYQASINSLMQATDNVFNVALFGFVICVSLILLIFNEVQQLFRSWKYPASVLFISAGLFTRQNSFRAWL